MITLTTQAAKQIYESAKQSKMEGMSLRLAVTRLPDDTFHYAMGFDDTGKQGDPKFESEGVSVVVSESSLPLLEGIVVDYVELEPGKFHFIFINPNDPNYTPPKESQEHDHSADDGCS